MFGPEYLDWKSECAAGDAIDAFLAGMEPEDRKWALAVLRKRHVTYRDRPQLFGSQTNYPPLSGIALQHQLANQRQQSQFGGLVSGIARDLGL